MLLPKGLGDRGSVHHWRVELARRRPGVQGVRAIQTEDDCYIYGYMREPQITLRSASGTNRCCV